MITQAVDLHKSTHTRVIL